MPGPTPVMKAGWLQWPLANAEDLTKMSQQEKQHNRLRQETGCLARCLQMSSKKFRIPATLCWTLSVFRWRGQLKQPAQQCGKLGQVVTRGIKYLGDITKGQIFQNCVLSRLFFFNKVES